jgi:phosphohistidine phosphatase
MRHGEAGESARGDAYRPLTHHGVAQAQASARGLLRLGVRPSALWHSPYLRAQQTATIVGDALGVALGVARHEDDRFVPDADPDVAARALLSGPRGTLLVVAHLPVLPGIVFSLGAGRVNLATASVVHVVVGGGSGVVAGLWTSEQLGQLAEKERNA